MPQPDHTYTALFSHTPPETFKASSFLHAATVATQLADERGMEKARNQQDTSFLTNRVLQVIELYPVHPALTFQR